MRQSSFANAPLLHYEIAVFKKRPRREATNSKRDPAYWHDRVYKNVFTYKGNLVEVRSWSVKIQVLGKRKAITLSSPDRAQAAGEACQIYQTIIEQGWEALNHTQHKTGSRLPAAANSTKSPASLSYDAAYWKHRLIQRKYPEPPGGQTKNDFSVRIEHGHRSRYFPLGTSNEAQAANLAMRIYRTIVNKSWEHAKETFPRELSVALRWQDKPVAWTYTTFHTRCGNDAAETVETPIASSQNRRVALIEPDRGIRAALVACINSQDGFRCVSMFASIADALREIRSVELDIALANLDLPGEEGIASFEELQRLRPGLVVLPYSVFADADDLFKSTPGGSSLYMLNRTSHLRLFEPIANLTKPLTQDKIASEVRNHFQQLAAMLPSSPPFWKLAKLTPREQEVLAHLSKGSLVKEIAAALGISNWTAQGHVKNIFEKLNVHSRTEAVVKYLQR